MSAGDSGTSRLICALDVADLETASGLVRALADHVAAIKIGKEFFMAHGPQGVRNVLEDVPLFLDLKLHDIPNTVAAAVRASACVRPAMLTLHACGGRAMMRAAVEAATTVSPPPLMLAVTVLTSLDDAALIDLGIGESAADRVARLAGLAQESGCDGVICSPRELRHLRRLCGPDFVLACPGIRAQNQVKGDQKRTASPGEAVAAGADYIIVGRPVIRAADPAAQARRIAQDMVAV